jgi:HEAT repeat protein
VVRYRALQHLKESRPEAIAAAAGNLLAAPNDQIRFLVCEILSKHGKPEHEEILVSLVRNPAGSKNPNVLRIRAVAALGHLGETEQTLEAIRPFAVSGDWFNGLTTTSVNALAAIGVRTADHLATVREILIASYPAPAAADDPRAARACRALAMRVHRALERLSGKSVPFPETYDQASRKALRDAW